MFVCGQISSTLINKCSPYLFLRVCGLSIDELIYLYFSKINKYFTFSNNFNYNIGTYLRFLRIPLINILNTG